MVKVLYIACSQERSQTVITMFAHLPEVELVCYSTDGFEALTLAALIKPDVVFLDAALERLTGNEVARALKSFHSQHLQRTILKILVLGEYIGCSELLAAVDISKL